MFKFPVFLQGRRKVKGTSVNKLSVFWEKTDANGNPDLLKERLLPISQCPCQDNLTFATLRGKIKFLGKYGSDFCHLNKNNLDFFNKYRWNDKFAPEPTLV